MKYKLQWGTYSHKVDGSRVRFQEGDIIEDVPQRHLDKWPDRFEEIVEKDDEENKEENNIENIDELLDEYYNGRGWYQLPDMDKSVREEEAREILEEGGIDG